MNKESLLEQKRNVDLVVSAYKKFLQKEYISNSTSRETAAEVLFADQVALAKAKATTIKGSLNKLPGSHQSRNPDPPQATSQFLERQPGGAVDLTQPASQTLFGLGHNNPSIIFAGISVDPDNASETFEVSEDTLKDWISECIPCGDRLKDLQNFIENLPARFLDILKSDIEATLGNLASFLDLLNGNEIFDDLCNLLNFLNFNCIPDLKMLLAVLAALAKKILSSIDINPFNILWDLLGTIMMPFLSGLEALLNQLLSLILAPITCMLNSLVFQISKIPGLEGEANWLQNAATEIDRPVIADPANPSPWNVRVHGQRLIGSTDNAPLPLYGDANRRPPADGSLNPSPSQYSDNAGTRRYSNIPFEDARGEMPPPTFNKGNSFAGFSLLTSWGSALSYLYWAVALGRNYMMKTANSIEDSLARLLGLSNSTMLNTLGAVENLKRIARIINIIQLMIKISQRFQGDEDALNFCSSETRGVLIPTEKMIQFIEQGLAGTTTSGFVRITGEDGSVSLGLISPETLDGAENIDLVGRPVGNGTAIVSRDRSIAARNIITQSQPKKIKTCFSNVSQVEMAKITDWITGLENDFETLV